MRLRAAVAAAMLALSLTGCGVVSAASLVNTGISNPPAPSASPSASAGSVYPGDLTCLMNTRDGDYSVFVLVKDTSDCGSWSTALASYGSYWVPVPTGGIAGTIACTLTANGMTVSVSEWSSVDEPIGGNVTGSVCQGLELNGWTPQS
jgi:hypothetical protein